MGVVLAVALFVVGLTPEQEVEAWQPPLAQSDRYVGAELGVRATTVLLPLGAIVVGTAVGFGSSFAIGSMTTGTIGAWSGLFLGVASFDAVLALGLHLLLPSELPSWTVPVAVVSATAAGAAGLVLGAGASFAYVSVAYAGSDCYCGQDLLLIPVVIGGLTAAGAVAGATLTVMAAETE